MKGIMLLTDPGWFAFQLARMTGKDDVAVFYASPHKTTHRDALDPLFCVMAGAPPRRIAGVGRIRDQVSVHETEIWTRYGTSLGAATEAEWRRQADSVLNNSRRTFGGKLLAIEVVDLRPYPTQISLASVGITNETAWSDKKGLDSRTTLALLDLLKSPSPPPSHGSGPLVPLREGIASDVLQTRHERNPEARKQCLAHYGHACVACGMSFSNRYGSIGDEFIHVHHLSPLAEASDERIVDPIADLRPVCPNCHAMLHRKAPPYSIEELRRHLEVAETVSRPSPSADANRAIRRV